MRCLPVLFLILLFVPACTKPIDTGPGLEVVGRQFSEAMRWQDYIGAANYLHEDVRQDFLEQFQPDEDLRVVDSRLISVDLNPQNATAMAVYQLEYYRLPSMRVKKWQWQQQWQLQQKKALKLAVWQIVNLPPEIP
jgi:hypothetical protein